MAVRLRAPAPATRRLLWHGPSWQRRTASKELCSLQVAQNPVPTRQALALQMYHVVKTSQDHPRPELHAF